MTPEQKNIDTVQSIYAAFGRGDIPAIIEALHPDAELEYGSDRGDIVPWLTPGVGRDHFARFFRVVADNLEFTRFQPLAVTAQGPWVLALISLEARVKKTGRTLTEVGEVHVWHFDAQGRVDKMRHAADTLQHARAYGAV